MDVTFKKGEVFYMDYTPTADVVPGVVLVIGNIPCVYLGPSTFSYDATRPTRMITLAVRGGIYSCTVDGAIGARKKVYWDNVAKKITLTEAGNMHFGYTGPTASANNGDIIDVEHGPNGQVGPHVLAVAGGYKVARGSSVLGGANPTTIATGLATIVAAVSTLKGTAAPGVGTSLLTNSYSGADGNLNVYAWKPTSNANPTLIASTGVETFDWIAFGT